MGFCQFNCCSSVRAGRERAAGKITGAAALARELLEDFFEQRVHVFCGTGILREDDASGSLIRQKCNGAVCARQCCRQMLQIIRRSVFQGLRNNANSVCPWRGRRKQRRRVRFRNSGK